MIEREEKKARKEQERLLKEEKLALEKQVKKEKEDREKREKEASKVISKSNLKLDTFFTNPTSKVSVVKNETLAD